MSSVHYIVATAGHVDHGKSALVRALTGIDPDRLPEEKARGITIELGFAHLTLDHPADPATRFEVGVVDVPGHEDFVKNMVAGVGSIDLALLVVAADDGWMPQTEEHLQILDYLGVTHAVVALTKCDLLSGRTARDPAHPTNAAMAVRERLAGSPFAEAPIVPTSALTGKGLDELRRTLAAALARLPPPRDAQRPRLSIDRAFTLTGAGTIVTGTLTGGCLIGGQTIVVQPMGRNARIRALQSHGREIAVARPGMRTALNLPEVPLAAQAPAGVGRGQVVTLPELGAPVRVIDVELRRSGRGIIQRKAACRPLKHGTRIRLHHGSTNVAGQVLLLKPLPAGGQGVAQLRLESPLYVLAGDRFILRDWAEQNTLAGGVVLDVGTTPKCFRSAEQQDLLARRARQPDDPGVWIATRLARDLVVPRDRLLDQTRFGPDDVAGALAGLLAEGRVLARGPLVVDPAWWRARRSQAIEQVRQHHLAHPEQAGLALTNLRSALGVRFRDVVIFDALVSDLCEGELIRDLATVRDRTHRPSLPASLQDAGARLRAQLAARPLDPPARSELAEATDAKQALRFLITTGEVVAAGADLVLLATAVARARQLIRQHIRKHGPATAGELRQALGTNRRVIIPLLEYLDQEGFTARQGDRRVLCQKPES